MFVVTGVTGNTGSVVAESLLAAGKTVRVVVRNEAKGQAWADRGAEVAVADALDADAMAAALTGADGVYLMSPPPVTRDDPFAWAEEVGESYAAALDKARPGKAVMLSSVAAQRAEGTGIIRSAHLFEKRMGASAVPLTFLRASFFMQNWGFVLQPVMKQGVLPSFAHPLDQRFDQVATQDIGAEAAKILLTETWAGRRVVELAGPEPRSPADAADAFATTLGKPVQAVAVPREGWQEALAPTGMPAKMIEAYIGMYDGINAGRIVWETDTQRRGSRSLEETLAGIVEGARQAA